MRLAPLLALLLAAPSLHAQANPNPPEAYYPLHVGDQWEYQDYDPAPNPNRLMQRRTVTGDTTVGGRRYFLVRDQRFQPWYSGTWRVDERREIVRFDTASANVRRLYLLDGGGVREDSLFRCRLDLPAPSGPGSAPCGSEAYVRYNVAPDTTIAIGGDLFATSVRQTRFLYFTARFAAGIGPIGSEGCEISCSDVRLTYARVDGVVRGEKRADWPNEPDLTPAASYYPLGIGTERIYYESTVLFRGYQRQRVVREETVGGVAYAVEAFDAYDLRAASQAWSATVERLVRFDPATTSVLVRSGAAEFVLYCALGADFDAAVSCGGEPQGTYADRGAGPVRIGGIDYPVSRVKGLRTLADPSPPPFAAGIGPLEASGFMGAGEYRFEFARVRGVEYGVRPAVSGEAGAPSADALALTTAPNPTSGALRLALTLPAAQTVAAEAFDALGRRVWQASLPMAAGPQTVDVDASAWAPGVYVVRVMAGSATATARVVRR